MVDRVITKNLAGLEDLLLGEGQENQTRSGDLYPITKIKLLWPCTTLIELQTLDPAKFTRAYYNGNIYKYDGGSWVIDLQRSLHIDVAIGTDQAASAVLSVSGYASATVKAFYTSGLAPISLQGYVFKNGSTYAVETVHNSGGFPGAGTLTLTALGTDITVAKTAGSTVGAGNLTLVLEDIRYA